MIVLIKSLLKTVACGKPREQVWRLLQPVLLTTACESLAGVTNGLIA